MLSTLKKRIIAALDVKEGCTVKGIAFSDLRQAGNPLTLAKYYSEAGIDELVLLDISATLEGRSTFVDLVSQVAAQIQIPFCVGGGIRSKTEAYTLLQAGADKIFVNSAAIAEPSLIEELALAFGSQAVVLAVDALELDGSWQVKSRAATQSCKLDLFEWTKRAENLGAGEILFTSISHDGTKAGYALNPLKRLSTELKIPVIASGGAGRITHFIDLFKETDCAAALAASIFHFNEIKIKELKQELFNQGVKIRLCK